MASSVATSITSIDDLNNKCLCEILLNIDVAERLQLRTVCKKWCKAVDDCWRAVRSIAIFHAISNERLPVADGLSQLDGTNGNLEIWSSDDKLIEEVMKRCGDVATSLLNVHRQKNDCVLPLAVQYCRSLRNITFSVITEADDEHLSQLLSQNKDLKYLDLVLAFKDAKLSFDQITTDQLEVLSLLGDSVDGLPSGLNQLIDRCTSSLNKLHIYYSKDDVFESIGKKTSLEFFYWKFIPDCDVTEKSLYHLLQLKNLKELNLMTRFTETLGDPLYIPPITDEFLIALSESLPQLQQIVLQGPLLVTDEGFKSLAKLDKLEDLCISEAPGVTDDFLELFTGVASIDLRKCDIGDAGVIRLLETSSTLQWLGLDYTLITDETLIAAVNMTQKRNNNGTCLTLSVEGTIITEEISTESAPLLNIAYCFEDRMRFAQSL